MSRTCEIKHSDQGEYYELWIDGTLMGTYDTASEAAIDCDRILEEWEK